MTKWLARFKGDYGVGLPVVAFDEGRAWVVTDGPRRRELCLVDDLGGFKGYEESDAPIQLMPASGVVAVIDGVWRVASDATVAESKALFRQENPKEAERLAGLDRERGVPVPTAHPHEWTAGGVQYRQHGEFTYKKTNDDEIRYPIDFWALCADGSVRGLCMPVGGYQVCPRDEVGFERFEFEDGREVYE
jgi:hypothetical protein